MKRMSYLSLILLVVITGRAEAGWLDNVKSRAQGIMDNKAREIENNITGSVEDALSGQPEQENTPPPSQPSTAPTPVVNETNTAAYEFGKLQDHPFWFIAPEGSTKAMDVAIKGLRLGMPEMFAEEALIKEGFKKVNYNAYVRIVKDGDTVTKRDDISFLAVEPSEEFINELDEPLKSQVLKAKEIIEENNRSKEEARQAARSGDRMARQRSSADNNIPGTLQLIYKISYNQSFNQSTKQDPMAMRQQLVSIFGEPSYANTKVSPYFLAGAAFDMNPQTDLYYHDAAYIPPAKKEALIKKAKVNEQKGVYDGFVHPCASGAGGRCPGLAMSAAYPDDFNLQMEASRIMQAPYLGIRFKGSKLETTLEWTYLQSEKSLRQYHTKAVAAENAPVATVDF